MSVEIMTWTRSEYVEEKASDDVLLFLGEVLEGIEGFPITVTNISATSSDSCFLSITIVFLSNLPLFH